MLIDHTQALASDRALCVGMPGQHQQGNAHILAARTRPHFQPRSLARPIRPADQAPFTLLLSHRCPLSQKGIHSCQGAWQTQLSRLPMLTTQECFITPWAPTAMLRGSTVTSFHNHFLPSLPLPLSEDSRANQRSGAPKRLMTVCLRGNSGRSSVPSFSPTGGHGQGPHPTSFTLPPTPSFPSGPKPETQPLMPISNSPISQPPFSEKFSKKLPTPDVLSSTSHLLLAQHSHPSCQDTDNLHVSKVNSPRIILIPHLAGSLGQTALSLHAHSSCGPGCPRPLWLFPALMTLLLGSSTLDLSSPPSIQLLCHLVPTQL